ncbi:hypothetical protein SDC9_129282 [bioreactor metagenome]|uniref:Uncharacterized protein n=1 Tax=bioreactor metagenome TaxID=1076179 RepID=A0A645CZA5_9ZZZZ
MRKITTKILAVFLALTMILGLTICASAAQKTIEPDLIFAGPPMEESTVYNIDISGNFIDFNGTAPEKAIEVYLLNEESGEYEYLCNLPAEFIFNSYSSTEDETLTDVTEIYIDYSDIQINEDAEYGFVLPEGLLKTADGSVNAEVGLSIIGSDILTPAYEPTPFDQFIDWLSSIPYIGVILARPILVLASFFQYIFGFVTNGSVVVG